MERYFKSKAYPKSIIQDREFLNSRTVLDGKARNLQEQGKGKQPETDPQVWQKKRKKSSGRTPSLEEAPHELYLTPCGGCSHRTSA